MDELSRIPAAICPEQYSIPMTTSVNVVSHVCLLVDTVAESGPHSIHPLSVVVTEVAPRKAAISMLPVLHVLTDIVCSIWPIHPTISLGHVVDELARVPSSVTKPLHAISMALTAFVAFALVTRVRPSCGFKALKIVFLRTHSRQGICVQLRLCAGAKVQQVRQASTTSQSGSEVRSRAGWTTLVTIVIVGPTPTASCIANRVR
mmetsp:Transcript_32085/g.73323  ORF Transcript_32085/g.73323 Transcript_32085/m.73323 type:complete len:204 (+) Transcript_32085:497-1108(+)